MVEAPTFADFVGAWALFRDPVLCAVFAGAVLGWLGVHVVLRRMVFFAATLSQAAGLGVALAFYAGIHVGVHVHPVLGAAVASLITAGLASLRAERLHLSRDALLAFAWLVAGAGAVLVGDRIAQEAHDVAGILFGTAVLVDPTDLALVLAVGGIALAAALVLHRGIVFAGYDPDGARVQGVPVRGLEMGLIILVTLVVSVSTRALGALPVFAFSVLPGVAALLASRRLGPVFPIAAALGALSGGLGYIAAFLWEFPVGASQTAVAVAFVLMAAPLRLLRR